MAMTIRHVVMTGMGCGLCVGALAGEAPTAPAATAAVPVVPELSTLTGLIAAGGWTMAVLLLMSLVVVFLTAYYLLSIREAVQCPPELLRNLERVAGEGDRESLRVLCRESDSVTALILTAGLEQVAGDKTFDAEAAGKAMDEEGSRQASLMWQRVQWLMDFAIVAPMVGLLGTVLGMMQAFGNLQTEIGTVIPASMSAGLAKAMVTTVGGLAVGIPSMLVFAFFRGRVMKVTAAVEIACGRITRALATAKKK